MYSTKSRALYRTFSLGAVLAAATAGIYGCGDSGEPYKPQPAWSGKKASIPAPQTLPSTPIKTGDAYTIYGAIHHLRSLIHSKEVTANPISITGYIVDSNVPRAPDCAVHKTGKADPDGCNPEIPSFWISDTKGDTKSQKIRVVGWARNFAVVYDAMVDYGKLKEGDKPKEPIKDDILNVEVPFPLPAVGAKVKITGRYNTSGRAGSDLIADPNTGVLLYNKMDVLEPASAPVAFAKKIP
jgi:hypothetical protein